MPTLKSYEQSPLETLSPGGRGKGEGVAPRLGNVKGACEQLLLAVSIQGPCTQQEVARHLGLKRNTVASHERNALRKLREAISRDKELYDFFLSHLSQPRPRQDVYKFLREE